MIAQIVAGCFAFIIVTFVLIFAGQPGLAVVWWVGGFLATPFVLVFLVRRQRDRKSVV